MADISKVTVEGATYNLKDGEARDELTAITNAQVDSLFNEIDLNLGNAEGNSF